MKIILLKDIANVGRQYETKEVSSGHALNMLIPKGLAVAATADAVKKYATIRGKIEGERKLQHDLLVKNLKDLDGVSVTIRGKANAKGHLFAGLHGQEIAAELKKQTKLDVDPAAIVLKQPLKEVGEHSVTVESEGKKATFKVIIEALEK